MGVKDGIPYMTERSKAALTLRCNVVTSPRSTDFSWLNRSKLELECRPGLHELSQRRVYLVAN